MFIESLSMFLADSYVHRLDPFAIQITETFGIRWYGLAYAVGFLLGWLFLRWMAKTGRSPMSLRDTSDIMMPIILGVLLGGRLGYCIFYEPSLLIDFSSQFPFWGVLAINRGGMASHGGMIGVILACMWFAWRRRISWRHLIDLGALGCTAGFFFGRLANFTNAELWGRPLDATMRNNPPWWSVKYPREVTSNWLRLVTEDNEASPELVRRIARDLNVTAPDVDTLREQTIIAVTSRLDQIEMQLRPTLGYADSIYNKVITAAQDASSSHYEAVVQTLRPLLTPYYPSQIIQALGDGLFVFVVLAIIWIKPRKPGVIGSWWLIVYGVLRIFTEQFRQPDEGVSLLFGLSRGQQLSILMVLAGIACLIWASRQSTEKLGGWIQAREQSAETTQE